MARLHRYGPPLLLGAVLVYYAGYVKDDAYISFRFAANWARGQGLAFNPGDPSEGYTNFGWTALVAGLLRLGIPALLGAKLLGAAAALALCAALAVGRAARSASWQDGTLAGLALAACALLRPEGHLLAGLGVLVAPRALPALVAVLVPYHLARYHHFGDLLPIPFHVKASAPSLAGGLRYAGRFLVFFGQGLLLAFALVAARHGDRAVRVAALACVAFVAYLVYVGGDEMRWYRLYAPALGLLVALAAVRLPALAVPAFVLAGLVYHGTAWRLRDYVAQDERGYFPLGDAIARRARPGDSALFQDAGATPFRALDVPFSDPIGVTDRRVARLYARARWSPFRGPGPPELERALRDELLGRDPRFIALVAYVPRGARQDVRAKVDADPEGTLAPLVAANGYVHGIPDDERFRCCYRFAGWWRRNDGYYLALYEKEGGR